MSHHSAVMCWCHYKGTMSVISTIFLVLASLVWQHLSLMWDTVLPLLDSMWWTLSNICQRMFAPMIPGPICLGYILGSGGSRTDRHSCYLPFFSHPGSPLPQKRSSDTDRGSLWQCRCTHRRRQDQGCTAKQQQKCHCKVIAENIQNDCPWTSLTIYN